MLNYSAIPREFELIFRILPRKSEFSEEENEKISFDSHTERLVLAASTRSRSRLLAGAASSADAVHLPGAF